MRPRPLFILMAFVFAAAIASAYPQNSSSGNPSQGPGQPSAGATSPPASPAQPAAKKVWTNEDVPTLRGDAPISTVGSTDEKPGSKAAPAARNANGRSYQARIARLEAQIPPLNSQIAELQAAIDGKPTGDAKSSQRPRGVKADDWNVEMQNLEKKRDGILDRIAALKDEARHQGVPPNTLP